MEEKKDTKGKSLPWFGIPALGRFLKPYRRRIAGMVLLGSVSSLIDSIYPLFNKHILNVNVGGMTLKGLPLTLILYLLILCFQVWDNYFTMFLCSRLELWMNRDLRDAVFGHVQTLSFSYFNQNSVGYIHSRVMSDTGKIGELVSWRMMDFVWNFAYILSVVVVMFLTDVRLALFILALVPIAVLIILFFQKKLVVLNHRVREINATITSDFNEGITGVRSIKALAAEEKLFGDFRGDTKDMEKAAVKTARNSALFSSSVTMFSALALALVLWQGGMLNQQNLMLIGTLSVFLSYALGIMDPIQNVINTLSALITIQVNIERVTRLLGTESDVKDSPEVIRTYGDSFFPKKENWEPLDGHIEFRDVSFRYPDGEEMVLEHFNLDVPQGASVAIVGETGAGKSTLVNLVCRFFEPTQGQVLIDGRDARERSQLWLHSHIGYVLQTPHLFTGTVRENLCYGNPDATDAQILEALALVSADQVVNRLEKGLDSEVGEGGSNLSTGERQLISFARAILADPRILVLDEATSSVDTVTEKTIQEATKKVTQGRTSFLIAHRLSTVTDCDTILAVKDGKIVEQGTHHELMEQKGYYYQLVMQQYEDEQIASMWGKDA
ncbi:MAG: ABC transporter ATP-binding protein/permease [Lachnospiraceae bacterium]|nr:ABC transporter ATP-binding protein/permease [Lachnospiraceae bacterium]